VSRIQLALTAAALQDAGPRAGDRIEHGADIPAGWIPRLAELGVTVVTQPNLVAERGDEYLREVPEADHPDLWRLTSLDRAGIPVGAGTDAPFGQSDPWAAMRAAVERRSPTGRPLGPSERATPGRALRLFLGRPDAPARARRVEVGSAADLCLLDRPWAEVAADLDRRHVRATIVGGRVLPGAN
jgi:predicted amidohydrolase YtcJ